ncbi:hypothetical protein SLE2022_236010 [Rubroshorea leprosula]
MHSWAVHKCDNCPESSVVMILYEVKSFMLPVLSVVPNFKRTLVVTSRAAYGKGAMISLSFGNALFSPILRVLLSLHSELMSFVPNCLLSNAT